MTEPNKERELLLDVRNVDITFYNKKVPFKAVSDASFQIFKGETFSLVGESGSGKTTIGRAIIRLNEISSGEIYYKGKRIDGKISNEEKRNVIQEIQMIFQDPAASLNERATIDYIVGEGLDNFKLYKDDQERAEKIVNALTTVGLLPEHRSRYPHEFSGGQRQRIGIARAVVMEPNLIVADEPISALDVSIRAQVLNLMNKFQDDRGLSYLFIAHDLSVVRYFSDRIGVIHHGKIVEIAETNELFTAPLHPYTRSLLQSVPMPDPRIEKAKEIQPYIEKERREGDVYEMREIVPDHFVYCTLEEMEELAAERKRMAEEYKEL